MKITALAGGVGGAKLVQGLTQILSPDNLSIIVNTGDDFELFGLYISPDIDTICYTLAGKANNSSGWGLSEESFSVLDKIRLLHGPAWFKIGDNDLATHLVRTQKIDTGETLTQVTRNFCDIWGINHNVLPMSNEPVRTYIDTVEEGILPFQEYFVKYKFNLRVKNIIFEGIEEAYPTSEVINSLKSCDAVIICPSNPFLSIDPILSLRGVKDILKEKYVTAVSPLIGGQAIKGPLAKMMREMNIGPSVNSIVNHYRDILDCIFLDFKDKSELRLPEHSSIISRVANILLPDIDRRKKLAIEIVEILKEKILY